MRILLDACVLVPTTLREMLIGTAAMGAFTPLWSGRLLEEWARAARRLPEGSAAIARNAIERLRYDWPDSEVPADLALEASLSLPDPNDVHVLAAAIGGEAEALMTLNRGDFPARTLARHGLILRDPDGYLCELLREGMDLGVLAAEVLRRAQGRTGQRRTLRGTLKRAGLPRLGKALSDGTGAWGA